MTTGYRRLIAIASIRPHSDCADECTYDRNLHAGGLNRLLDDAKSAAHLADLCYIVIIFPAVARGGPGDYSALDDVCHGSAIQISNYASTFPETGYLPQIVERSGG